MSEPGAFCGSWRILVNSRTGIPPVNPISNVTFDQYLVYGRLDLKHDSLSVPPRYELGKGLVPLIPHAPCRDANIPPPEMASR